MAQRPCRQSKGLHTLLLRTFLLLCSLLSLFGCKAQPETIRIGFVGTLTGRYSDLGVSGRDGVILAVEEKNGSGGLAGRPIELLVRDDGQDPDMARRVDEELMASGVIAIIGHMTSEISLAVLPLINSKLTVMISPTASSAMLSGQKDFFFRVFEAVDRETVQLASWAKMEGLGLKSMVVLYDLDNRAYAEDYAQRFQKAYTELNGQVLAMIGLESSRALDAFELSQRIRSLEPDGVLLVLNSMDTAFVLQHLRASGWRGTAFASKWSMTKEILEQGNKASEGLYSITNFLPEHPSQRYRSFREGFLKRFRREPDFPAASGYEAAQLLFIAYEEALSGGKRLAEAITRIGQFEGLQSRIHLDEFGDPQRENFRVAVKDGRITRIQ